MNSIWYPTAFTVALIIVWLYEASKPTRGATIGSAIGEGVELVFFTLIGIIAILCAWLLWSMIG